MSEVRRRGKRVWVAVTGRTEFGLTWVWKDRLVICRSSEVDDEGSRVRGM